MCPATTMLIARILTPTAVACSLASYGIGRSSTVATDSGNGKVYVATQTQLSRFGLLSSAKAGERKK